MGKMDFLEISLQVYITSIRKSFKKLANQTKTQLENSIKNWF